MSIVEQEKQAREDLIRLAGKNWPAPFVARSAMAKFTGGAYSPKTMSNLDSLGKGPSGRFRLGLQVVYPVNELCDWLIERSNGKYDIH